MGRLLKLLVFLLSFSCLVGCNGSAGNKTGVQVTVDGNGQFPDYLVGRWKANEYGWEFVFEPDGTISSAIHSLARIEMKPGQPTIVPMKKGGQGVFEPGEWLVNYIPDTRELTVQVSLKNFRAQMGDNILEGKSTDIFVGPVSKDGTRWEAVWTSFPDYTAHTSEYPNFDMFPDPNYSETKMLVFEKVGEE